MSTTILLSELAGCKLHRRTGEFVGRITGVGAEVELTETGKDYVVTRFTVSHFGPFEWLAHLHSMQQLLERLGTAGGYRCWQLPASRVDLGDARHPILADDEPLQASSTSTWLS